MADPTDDVARRLERMQTQLFMLKDFLENGVLSDNGMVPASKGVLLHLTEIIRLECKAVSNLYESEQATPESAMPIQSKALH